MSLLLQESPLQVLPSLAVALGLNEALLIQQLHYWLVRSENEVDGERWVYNSYEDWLGQFPFWSESTLKRTLASLRQQGVLLIEKLSPDRTDRRNYYRIDYKSLISLIRSKWPDATGQNDPIHQVNLTQSIRSKWPDVLTEITTEITTDIFAPAAGALDPVAGVEPPAEPVPETPPEAPEAPEAKKRTRAKPKSADAQDTALQAACRATWSAYATAYQRRYGAAPVRNQKVNSQVKALVRRLGYEEAPEVVAFYLRLNDRKATLDMHDLGGFLYRCEAIRTQWVTGQTMTHKRAEQVDRTAANANAAADAKALLGV